MLKTISLLSAAALTVSAAILSPSEKGVTVSVTPSAKPLENKVNRQVTPPPATFPSSFRIQFTTSAGESVDAVATFQGSSSESEPALAWRTPPVTRTVDHAGVVKVISEPIELTYYVQPKAWMIHIGNSGAFINGHIAQRSPLDFDLPCSPFRCGSIFYSNFRIN